MTTNVYKKFYRKLNEDVHVFMTRGTQMVIFLYYNIVICLLYTLRKEKAIVTQTYQIITKHTQHRNKLIIYMITLLHKSILYSYSHTTKKIMTYIYNT